MPRFYWPVHGPRSLSDQVSPGRQDALVDWFARSPEGQQHPAQPSRGDAAGTARERGARQLLRSRSFRTTCAKNQLTIEVHLPTPEEARRLMPEVRRLESDMHGMEVLLLQQFVEKDWGDDLLLLTATEEPSGHMVGMIFWRYLRRTDDEHWSQVHVNWESALGPDAGQTMVAGKPLVEAWTLIELLCTDQRYRGHGIGRLLLGAALAYSSVKDGRTAAVLTLGHGDENTSARELYGKMGFEEMPEAFFAPAQGKEPPSTVDHRHVLVVWDIKKALRSMTLGSLSGADKGTNVPQLHAETAPAGDGELQAMRHLDSQCCLDVVNRLTGASVDLGDVPAEN